MRTASNLSAGSGRTIAPTGSTSNFRTGHRTSLPSHPSGAAELRRLVSSHFDIADLQGLDLLPGRFAGDSRWNPECGIGMEFEFERERLEKAHCRDARFIDHVTRLRLVARPGAVRPRRERSMTVPGSGHPL
jgi:hypothetical protein